MEDGAAAWSGLETNLAPQVLNRAFGDGQPEPGAVVFGREERFKDTRLLFWSDAPPGVFDIKLNHATVRAEAHGDLPALGHGLPGIDQQVQNHATKLPAIPDDRRDAGAASTLASTCVCSKSRARKSMTSLASSARLTCSRSSFTGRVNVKKSV